jgi:hypothetical protein
MKLRHLIFVPVAALVTAGIAYAGDAGPRSPVRLPAVQREAAGAIAPMFTPKARLPAVQREAAGIVGPMFTPKAGSVTPSMKQPPVLKR